MASHGLSWFLLAVAAALAAWSRLRRPFSLFGPIALGLFALGGIVLPLSFGWIGAAVGFGLVFVLFLIAYFTGAWNNIAGGFFAAIGTLCLGAAILPGLDGAFTETIQFLTGLDAAAPMWLLLLALLPYLVWVSYERLASLGPGRRWLAIVARCLLMLAVILALAEVHGRRPENRVTVLFLWDKSLSIPQEWAAGQTRDQRQDRLFRFINESVALRPAERGEDRVGLIVFGKQPRLELPPSSVPQLNLRKIQSPIDSSYTDISAAFKLALASFPEETAKRIVLISDGNENLGRLEEQARFAKQNGVQVDIVPITAANRRQEEVVVDRLEAPLYAEKDSRLPLHVVLRSYHPQEVAGMLNLSKTSLENVADDKGNVRPAFQTKPVLSTRVKLRQGLNVFQFQQPGLRDGEAVTYEVQFVPLQVVDGVGKVVQEGLPGDRPENNKARANILSRGPRAVLLLETEVGTHKLLVERLQTSKAGLRVVAMRPSDLPQDLAQLALFLSRFDSVVVANVPAEEITPEQQTVLRANTHDQGSGLVMIGGPQSYGAGGWQGTELEKALPVTSDIKSMKLAGKSGLVLIMHASEMAEGNAWQKQIAQIALDKLSPIDMVGLIDWNGVHNWHVPFQEVGEADNRLKLKRLVDTLNPGDMGEIDTAFNWSYDALMKPAYNLGTKHIILISDGDHWEADLKVLAKLRGGKITCTTVCITTHGPGEVARMKAIAQATKGRDYFITNPKTLPEIYTKETRLVSQAYVYDKTFGPQLISKRGPTEGIAALPDLHGFVRTTRRPSPLVEVPIQTPKLGEFVFPVLATWHYGLGKSVAFTSDARTTLDKSFWDRDWANSEMYKQFWKQTIEWSLRAVETGQFLTMTTEIKDGKVRVAVEAQDKERRPITDAKLKAGISSPSFKEDKKVDLVFEQKNSGVYEAEFPVDEVGSYFLHIQGEWTDKQGNKITDGVSGALTVPYSPEFAEMESNTQLLEKIADLTDGQVYLDDDRSLAAAARAGNVFRPVPQAHRSLQTLWYFLVVAAGILLFLDVAIRRISLDPRPVVNLLNTWWAKLRREAVPAVATGDFLDRLKTRKAQVSEGIDKGAKRYEGPEAAPISPTAGPTATPLPSAKAPEKPAAAEQAEDYVSRMMKAKKRAQDERDKK